MNLHELTKLYDFSGRSFVFTGGTGILGREMVDALRGCNANVAVLARSPEKAKKVLAPEQGFTGRLLIVEADVLDGASLRKAAKTIQAEFSRIDGLINGAGGNHPGATSGPDKPFFDMPSEALKFVQELNLHGTILPSQIFGKLLAEQGSGVILNISSMSAFQPLTKVVGYSAAKAAVNNFTCWLAVHMAQEYSPEIRVNAIAPGFFLTEQNRFLLTDEKTGELSPRGKTIIEHTPMNRFGKPEDLLGGLLWLLSPASAFVTGIVLPIDGGFNAFSGV